MSLLSLFRRPTGGTATAARERLQILLAHERASLSGADFLPQLQRELLDVIRKYVQVDDERVQVKLDSDQNFSVLEVNIELPAASEHRSAR
ncbi:cell division topological specificity factor MinE [Telmatospirillum sp.]|uniref:cell division topological specificity factor MinE n=1 Tax=Telmatospirillum sp. TaxID=2079197 RepID=UPI00283BFC15|nr:cell division topological specificity factor MinE [Telmatospirillum sp.]MDR3439757.1 cell division topological specificity factor MinE [Telmatospirillum sp.]